MTEWFLSDEQMHAIRDGGSVSWAPLELPVGPRPLPAWARGLDVDFHDGFGNVPSYRVTTTINPRQWPNKRFRREGAAYIAEHEDGRAEVYYHSGAVRPATVRRFQTPDGKLHAHRPYQPFGMHHRRSGHTFMMGHGMQPGVWVDVERPCTAEQQGFGGSHIDIVLEDGTEMTLRGPWHGGAPKGFVEVGYRDRSSRWGGLGAGLYLREECFVRLFARYSPHLRLVRYQGPLGERIQALKPEWDCPKDVWMQREKEAHLKRTLAALAQATSPLSPVMDRDHVLAPWALNDLAFAKLAERTGPWNAAAFVITDLGRQQASGAAAANQNTAASEIAA